MKRCTDRRGWVEARHGQNIPVLRVLVVLGAVLFRIRRKLQSSVDDVALYVVDGGFRVLDLYRLVVGGNKTVHLYVHTQSCQAPGSDKGRRLAGDRSDRDLGCGEGRGRQRQTAAGSDRAACGVAVTSRGPMGTSTAPNWFWAASVQSRSSQRIRD